MYYACYMNDQPTSFRIPGELAEALEAYRKSSEWTPSKTAVIRKALEDFLTREGFYQPTEKSSQEQR